MIEEYKQYNKKKNNKKIHKSTFKSIFPVFFTVFFTFFSQRAASGSRSPPFAFAHPRRGVPPPGARWPRTCSSAPPRVPGAVKSSCFLLLGYQWLFCEISSYISIRHHISSHIENISSYIYVICILGCDKHETYWLNLRWNIYIFRF